MNQLTHLSLLLSLGISLLAADLPTGTRRVPDKAPGSKRPPLMDRADLRHKAEEEWSGGPWTPEYQRFVMGVAAQERERHEDLHYGSRTAALAAPGTLWTNLGPANASYIKNGSVTLNVVDSGRLRTILVHPTNASIIYVATSGGGVWKTINGGTSWTAITDSLGALSNGALAMDPNAPETLFLALGDPFDGTGLGFVKSTDGGTSWSTPVMIGDSTKSMDLVVSPVNTQILLAGTNKGVMRSTDSGATWTNTTPALGITTGDPICWDIAWTGGSNFVASFSDRLGSYTDTGQVWYTSDDGATWTKSTGMTFSAGLWRISLAAAASNLSTMYAMASKPLVSGAIETADIFKSLDGGHSWTALNIASKNHTNGAAGGFAELFAPAWAKTGSPGTVLGGQGFYNHAIAIDPSDPNKAYFSGQLYTTYTADGGNTWKRVTDWMAQASTPYVHADSHCTAWGPDGSLYIGSDGGIFKSTDKGTTWTDQLNKGIVSHLLYSVGSSLANRNAIIGGLQDNGTRVRSAATATFNATIGGDGFGSMIHAKNASLMLGSIYYADAYKSTDGGANFTESITGITGAKDGAKANFWTRFYAFPGDTTGNTVFTFTNASIFKSTDFGSNWSGLGTGGFPANWVIRNMACHATNSQVYGTAGAVGTGVTDPRVFLTQNAGSTWNQVGTWPSGTAFSYIWIDTNNINTVYVAAVTSSATANHLWKSSNFGGSWTAIDGNGFPFGIPVNVIQNDPGDSNTLYAGTNLGVYKSTDGGTSWSRFGTGLPLVNVKEFYLAPDSSLMRAATFGRGFWELATGTPAETVTASITSPASNVTIATGASVNFTGSATSDKAGATFTYSWNFGDGSPAASGATTSHTFTNTGTANVTRTVTLSATSNGGASASAQRLVTVQPAPTAPTITSQPQNASVAAGATATFSVTATGSAPLSYQWRKNAANIAGATSASYTTPATTTADNGAAFSVVVSNSAGSATSANATLTVTAPVVAVSITPATATIDTGATQQFTASVTGSANTAVTWTATGGTVSATGLYTAPATAGTYTVTATSAADTTKSASATVTVNPVTAGTFNEVEPNNTIAAANAVGASYTAIKGTHAATGNPDFFALTLAPSQKLTIAMTGPAGVDWDLALKNSAGTNLASSTGSTATENLTYTNTGAAAVTVYANVYVYSGVSATPYNLALTYFTPPPPVIYAEVEANNSIATANPVPDNATKIVGYIGSSTDNDYFKVNVGAGKKLTVAMTGPTGSAYDYDLYFYNAAGTQLAKGTGSTTTENVSWTNGATATAVYVVVKRYAGSSTTVPYNLNITR
ncbi:MAG: PKD domain-containing protein [Holophagaceae bacterium]|nr:PKD domain-containing protein [Holophagaceae bacterium]